MEIHIFSNESKCSVCVLCGIEQYNKRIMEFPNIQLHPIALTYRPAIHTSDVWPRKPSIRIRCREEIPQLDTPYSSIHVALPAPHRLRSILHIIHCNRIIFNAFIVGLTFADSCVPHAHRKHWGRNESISVLINISLLCALTLSSARIGSKTICAPPVIPFEDELKWNENAHYNMLILYVISLWHVGKQYLPAAKWGWRECTFKNYVISAIEEQKLWLSWSQKQ